MPLDSKPSLYIGISAPFHDLPQLRRTVRVHLVHPKHVHVDAIMREWRRQALSHPAVIALQVLTKVSLQSLAL